MSGGTTGRRWSLVLLGAPLAVVGASAMAISYATLIDVARVNGMPLPELFPVVIDVGTVACMLAAAEFRRRSIRGGWLAYLTFSALSALSVFANAAHAISAADLNSTTAGVAVMIAATPPAALLAITHLVMRLVPVENTLPRPPSAQRSTAATRSTELSAAAAPVELARQVATAIDAERTGASAFARKDVDDRIAAGIATGMLPTGREVGDWMGGKSSRTGQRYIAAFLKAHGEDVPGSSMRP